MGFSSAMGVGDEGSSGGEGSEEMCSNGGPAAKWDPPRAPGTTTVTIGPPCSGRGGGWGGEEWLPAAGEPRDGMGGEAEKEGPVADF